jgi:hypothetical protein
MDSSGEAMRKSGERRHDGRHEFTRDRRASRTALELESGRSVEVEEG